MTKKKINEATFSIRFRAQCTDDSFRGKWRNSADEAYLDANKHRSKPGNKNHVIRIVAEQKMDIGFVGN